MLEKLSDFIGRQKSEWKSHFFREPQQRRFFLLVLASSVFVILFSVYDYPTNPGMKGTALMLAGICGGIAGLLGSVAELLPKSQTQLAGIFRMWAALAALCTVGAMTLQFLPISWLY